jgi:predicted NBD/HSP70 family sugar kinase
VRCGQLDGVGIGLPSVVKFETGRVVASDNLPLADVPLRRVLEERLGVPVFVDNDATVAALAEAHDDELSMVSRNLVMLTVGTGVGGGLILGGRIYRGATGGAGELGHTRFGGESRRRRTRASHLPATRIARAFGRGARARPTRCECRRRFGLCARATAN